MCSWQDYSLPIMGNSEERGFGATMKHFVDLSILLGPSLDFDKIFLDFIDQ